MSSQKSPSLTDSNSHCHMDLLTHRLNYLNKQVKCDIKCYSQEKEFKSAANSAFIHSKFMAELQHHINVVKHSKTTKKDNERKADYSYEVKHLENCKELELRDNYLENKVIDQSILLILSAQEAQIESFFNGPDDDRTCQSNQLDTELFKSLIAEASKHTVSADQNIRLNETII